MSLRRVLSYAALTVGLAVFCAGSAFAQQTPQNGGDPQTPGQGGRGPRGGGPGMGPGGGIMRMMNTLNLTDAQKQQIQGFVQKSEESNRPLREQMRTLSEQDRQGTLSVDDQAKLKQLRIDMRAANEKLHKQIVEVLTPEQRTQLEQEEQQRRQNRPGPGAPGGPPPPGGSGSGKVGSSGQLG